MFHLFAANIKNGYNDMLLLIAAKKFEREGRDPRDSICGKEDGYNKM
ncbi:hypothetical protein PROFUN_11932 [Planoprotostelium fungivorum]|uniref:Uncharacterized protein n=1 Tax=Planoprotostelium fungivorum TaxID=1890364 RepID=A0A2P6N8T4_9EUKA|nr:hypothetical protein PROFUN_11932 [Planoprotostelium fungivorum]